MRSRLAALARIKLGVGSNHLPRSTRRVVRYLTADEARRLVACCNENFRRLVQAALLTGCRYSELTRLRASAFNPDSGTLAIRLSKGKVRHVTLTDEGAYCFLMWSRGRLPTDHSFSGMTAPSGDRRISSVRSNRRARRRGSHHLSPFISCGTPTPRSLPCVEFRWRSSPSSSVTPTPA